MRAGAFPSGPRSASTGFEVKTGLRSEHSNQCHHDNEQQHGCSRVLLFQFAPQNLPRMRHRPHARLIPIPDITAWGSQYKSRVLVNDDNSEQKQKKNNRKRQRKCSPASWHRTWAHWTYWALVGRFVRDLQLQVVFDSQAWGSQHKSRVLVNVLCSK